MHVHRRWLRRIGLNTLGDQIPVVVEGHRAKHSERLVARPRTAISNRIGRWSIGSARSSSRNATHRRSKATFELTSSSTSTCGGRPASTGCSESRTLGEGVRAFRWPRRRAARGRFGTGQRRRHPEVITRPEAWRSSSWRTRSRELGPRLVGEGNRGDGAQLGPAARDERKHRDPPGRSSCLIPHRPPRQACSRGPLRSGHAPHGLAAPRVQASNVPAAAALPPGLRSLAR